MKKLKLEDMTGKDEDQTQTYIEHPETTASDEISLKAIQELLNIKKLKTISRIKFDQVQILSKLFLYSETFNDPFTKKLADLILQLQISTSGLGRRELVQLVQQRSELVELPQQKTSKDIFR
jgi:hypothetical protein